MDSLESDRVQNRRLVDMVMNSGFHKTETLLSVTRKRVKRRSICQTGSLAYSLEQPVHVDTNQPTCFKNVRMPPCHTDSRDESEGRGGAAKFVQFICLGCSWKIASLVIRSRQADSAHMRRWLRVEGSGQCGFLKMYAIHARHVLTIHKPNNECT